MNKYCRQQLCTQLFFFAAAACLLNSASADQISSSTLKDQWASALAGVASTIAIHELGHFAAAEIEGNRAYFDDITVRYHEPAANDRQALRLSSAGYHGQWLASEYAFYRLSQPKISAKSKSFHAGMVLGHISITLAYASILKGHKNGDLSNSANVSGISEDKLLLALAVPAALDAWRLFGDAPRWVPWLSRSAKGVGIAWSWTH